MLLLKWVFKYYFSGHSNLRWHENQFPALETRFHNGIGQNVS